MNIENYFPEPNEKWNRVARKVKEIEEMSEINSTIKEEELEKRIRTFHLKNHPIYINIKGKRFIYQIPKQF